MTLRLATRGSRLAMTQSTMVAGLIKKKTGEAVEIVEVETKGDRDQSTPLTQGQGWFTVAIQDALLRGEADLAVHSYKDLPSGRPEGLVIGAIPSREDPRDAFVSGSGKMLLELPAGAIVGTGSPRRMAQVLEIRPDVEVRAIRGNVETRLAKVESGEYDAVVLALAGLRRLGLEERTTQVFRFEEMLPAPAQGALAVECRAGDERALTAAQAIDDPSLRPTVGAERGFLAALEAGCDFPSGAYAERFGSTVKLHGLVAHEGRIVRSKIGGPAEAAVGLGRELAQELLGLAGLR